MRYFSGFPKIGVIVALAATMQVGSLCAESSALLPELNAIAPDLQFGWEILGRSFATEDELTEFVAGFARHDEYDEDIRFKGPNHAQTMMLNQNISISPETIHPGLSLGGYSFDIDDASKREFARTAKEDEVLAYHLGGCSLNYLEIPDLDDVLASETVQSFLGSDASIESALQLRMDPQYLDVPLSAAVLRQCQITVRYMSLSQDAMLAKQSEIDRQLEAAVILLAEAGDQFGLEIIFENYGDEKQSEPFDGYVWGIAKIDGQRMSVPLISLGGSTLQDIRFERMNRLVETANVWSSSATVNATMVHMLTDAEYTALIGARSAADGN